MARLIVAVLLAPAFVASLVAVFAAVRQGESSAQGFGVIVIAVFLVAYMIAIVPTALVVIALKVLSYDSFSHFVAAGFATGVGCTLFFTMTGYSALLHDFGAWLERASVYWFLLPIGALAGAFVWMVGEWTPHWLADE